MGSGGHKSPSGVRGKTPVGPGSGRRSPQKLKQNVNLGHKLRILTLMVHGTGSVRLICGVQLSKMEQFICHHKSQDLDKTGGCTCIPPPPAAATLKLPLYATECYATCCRISFWSSVVVHVHHDAWPIYFVMEMFIHHEGRYTKYNAR